MAIDRKLLWKAWPEGYVALRGVSTIGGWECVTAGHLVPEPNSLRLIAGGDVPAHQRAYVGSDGILLGALPGCSYGGILKRGDLLPNVDPTDTATWACLLKDMCDVVVVITDYYDPTNLVPDSEILGYTLELQDRPDLANSDRPYVWSLMMLTKRASIQVFSFLAETQDPAEALVEGLIGLREITAPIIALTSDGPDESPSPQEVKSDV